MSIKMTHEIREYHWQRSSRNVQSRSKFWENNLQPHHRSPKYDYYLLPNSMDDNEPIIRTGGRRSANKTTDESRMRKVTNQIRRHTGTGGIGTIEPIPCRRVWQIVPADFLEAVWMTWHCQKNVLTRGSYYVYILLFEKILYNSVEHFALPCGNRKCGSEQLFDHPSRDVCLDCYCCVFHSWYRLGILVKHTSSAKYVPCNLSR